SVLGPLGLRGYNRPPMRVNSRCRRWAGLAAMAVVFLSCAPALAKVQLSVDVGWSNRFRAGRWTPLYVTLADSSPRQVIVDIYAPTDRRYALRASQSIAIGPAPVTIALYAPLSYRVDESILTVRDANTGRRIDYLPLSDYQSYPGSAIRGPEAVEPNALFVGVSGNFDSERMVEGQLSHNGIKTCFIPQSLLPAVAIGYDSLDLLILNQPDLVRINVDQQRAIADWVRAGGLLVL